MLGTIRKLAPIVDNAEVAIAQLANQLYPRLIETRRNIYMYPELSNREARTASLIATRLHAAGFHQIETDVAGHGVVAILNGAQPGPVVAMRADMDALPIEDTITQDYRSRIAGQKHACGHDAHTAIQLVVAEILAELREYIPGQIKFIFQPAEEGVPVGEEGGASLMINAGVLADPSPQAIFALHVMPEIAAGQIAYCRGAALASADDFVISLHGKKSHAAYPHQGINAIAMAAEVVTAVHSLNRRYVRTETPAIISIGTIKGGNRANIIADEVILTGTVRTLNMAARKELETLLQKILAGVTSRYQGEYCLDYLPGCPVTYNDPSLVTATLPTIEKIVGAQQLREVKPQLGSEDFSFFQQIIPGFYLFLGVGNQAKGIIAPTHSSNFDIDESSLVTGVNVMANILIDYLKNNC